MGLKIATAQFENKSGDKKYNLSVIEKMAKEASQKGAEIIAFHECSITGYTFAMGLSRDEMLDLAEIVDSQSPSIIELTRISQENSIIILAGLFKKTKRMSYIKHTFVLIARD